MDQPHENVKVFGAALDPIDNPIKVLAKCSYINRLAQGLVSDSEYADPYDGLINKSDVLKSSKFKKIGKIQVESWLTPRPNVDDFHALNPANFQKFVNMGGVREYAERVEKYVEINILPDVPLMIGADHALTGGVLSALAKRYGSSNILVIVVDAHFDAIPASISLDLARFARDHEQEVKALIKTDGLDSGLEIVDTYTCASYLDYLIEEEIIFPENLIIFGCQDYPGEQLRAESDPRAKNFVDRYFSYEKMGVNVIPATENAEEMIGRLRSALQSNNLPFLYISFDVDVGMFKDILAARFMNAVGINKTLILKAAREIKKHMIKKNCQLIGTDIMEIETQVLGKRLKKSGKQDKTVDVLDDYLSILFQ